MYVTEDHVNWDGVLPYAKPTYNTARHGRAEYSSYFLLYAREPHPVLKTALSHAVDQHLNDFVTNLFYPAEEAGELPRINTSRSQKERYSPYNASNVDGGYNISDQVSLQSTV